MKTYATYPFYNKAVNWQISDIYADNEEIGRLSAIADNLLYRICRLT